MRVALHEFFRPTKEEFEKFWADALITFDASSLLNLYGYSAETKKELLKTYNKFKTRIVLPYQFALEYSRNRARVISNQISNFQKAQKDLEDLIKKHNVRQDQPYLSDISLSAAQEILKELSEGKSKLEKSMASDDESDLLLSLFDGKIGPEPTADELTEFYTEGKARYDVEIPPGFKDVKEKGEPDCYGDFIAWKQIMGIATERGTDIILVTDDVKEDWWHYESSRTVGPLPALRKEFRSVTGQSVWLYTTEGFLRAAKEFSEVRIGDAALKEVSAALNTQYEERLQRLLKFRSDPNVMASWGALPDDERTLMLLKFFGSKKDFKPDIGSNAASSEDTKKKTAPREDHDAEEDEEKKMAVRAFTDHPEALLSAIKREISGGRVRTWKIDEDGDLTLTQEEFASQAWMRPKILSDRLLFNFIGSSETSTRQYAVYHGRLVQMLLNYFDTKLRTASATSLPTPGDHVPS